MLGLILATFAQPKEKAYKSKEKLYNKLDIEKADMSQKIQELIILKQEILNNLSHEIRTPIHHIGSGAEAIYKDWDKYTPKQIREFAEMIYIGYQNATKYINSLLDLSDLSSNKVKLNLVQTNFVSIVENSVEEFKELYLQNSNLQINICSNESHLKVTCDEDKIKKVITSLLENAVQYGQESLIEIIIDKSQRTNSRKFAKFIIRDFGIGIPEDELVHIFEPFAQSSSTKKMSGGRGIGLALCEQIIVMHQGKIWAENNVGKPGSMFSFMLPLDLSA
jgi:signal transduction histidine kinase